VGCDAHAHGVALAQVEVDHNSHCSTLSDR
jgi:hypothetical protein